MSEICMLAVWVLAQALDLVMSETFVSEISNVAMSESRLLSSRVHPARLLEIRPRKLCFTTRLLRKSSMTIIQLKPNEE